MTIIDEIISHKKLQIDKKKLAMPLEKLKEEIASHNEGDFSPRDFKSAISSNTRINIIAELKKSAPVRGILRPDYDVKKIAAVYSSAGAVALSVLTEERFFEGDIFHMIEARQAAQLPILRKDFIIDAYQIYESRYYGADAVLFIKSILNSQTLSEFVKIAISVGLTPLVEIHTEEELSEILNIPEIDVIGINNRDLKTLKVDISVSKKLIPKIPADKLLVIESGITKKEDLLSLITLRKESQIAFLIGTVFMQSPDIVSKFKEFVDDKS